MANINELIQEINTNLPDNNVQSITAQKLRDTLISGIYETTEIYDVSANNNGAKYADLTSALGTNGVNVPEGIKKGGMSIKFVRTSDNKYVQYRYTLSSISNSDFANVANWQGVDDEPTEGSNNLVKSGGVYLKIDSAKEETLKENREMVNSFLENYAPIEITGNVTNAPDEEDLTSVNVEGTDVLKFKDKAYNPLVYSGLGKKILRKNIVDGVNILTQSMMQDTNTIYIIQYDYNLGGETVTIPTNCVLKFDGGSLSNGELTGQDTIIDANLVKIFNADVDISGTWNVLEAYPEWFGAVGDGETDDTNSVQSALDFSFLNSKSSYKSTVTFTQKYKVSSELIVRCNTSFSNRATIKSAFSGITFHILQSWTTHYNISITGSDIEGSCGIKIGGIVTGETSTRGYHTCIYSPIVGHFEYGLAICTFQNDIISPRITNCIDAIIAAETQNAGWINLNRFFGGTIQATRYAAFMGDNRNLPILPSNQNFAKQGINISFFGVQFIGKVTLQNVSPVAFYGNSFEWIEGQSSDDKIAIEILDKTTSIIVDNASFDKYDYCVKCIKEFRIISITNCVMSRISYCGVYTTDDRGTVIYKSNSTENTCFTSGTSVHVGKRAYVDSSNYAKKIYTDTVNNGIGELSFSFNGNANKAVYPQYNEIGENNILTYCIDKNVCTKTEISTITDVSWIKTNEVQLINGLSVAGLVPNLKLRVYNNSTVVANTHICRIDYKNNILFLNTGLSNVTNIKIQFIQATFRDTAQVVDNNTLDDVVNKYAGKLVVHTDKRYVGFYDGANFRRFDGNLLSFIQSGSWSQISGQPGVVNGTVAYITDYKILAHRTSDGWRAYDGESPVIKRSGTTQFRPTPTNIGFRYFDTTLNKPIYWTGEAWVDAAGTTA